MLKIGVTGGIGSGKTTVCEIFSILGVPVYYADPRAKELMVTDPVLISAIKSLLGKKSYNEDSTLNKQYIAKIIFNDKNKLKKLNSLVHPAVKQDFENWCKSQKTPYILKEAALLFESGSYKDLDKTILVTAPLELRISRVMQRDNSSRDMILSRVKNQMLDTDKEKLSDYIILNDNKNSLVQQIIKLHNQFIKESNAKVR